MTGTLEEHHGYLSDARRIAQFEKAIARSVRPGDVVVDLGCGFGVLGFMCLEAGAARVYGIDSTDAIDIARETAARAGLADRYVCLRGRSFELDIPERVDVLICDHVGYFGIDYGIVAMLADARRRFLKPGGRIIPEAVTPMLAAVRSDVARDTLEIWSKPDIPANYAWLRDYAVNTKHALDYSSQAIASQPVQCAVVDFAAEVSATIASHATLEADLAGRIDGIGGWFDCTLAGDVTMTNSPLASDRIDRQQIFLGLETPFEVEAGDLIEVDVRVRHEDSIVAWSVLVPRTGQRERHSTWASMPLSEGERLRPNQNARTLNARGRAAQLVLAMVDGARTGAEIEAAILAEHPELFPDAEQMKRFIRAELARSSR